MACWCRDGWVCEDHPDQPPDHDPQCPGAGALCANPDCPLGHAERVRLNKLRADRHQVVAPDKKPN